MIIPKRIKATNLEMTDALRDYFVEKIAMLDKYLGSIQVIHCDCEIEKSVGGQNKGEIFRAEINIEVPGDLLRVEKTETDMYKAIDKVKDHMELVIKKYKEKKEDAR